jgi:hypothetical protein
MDINFLNTHAWVFCFQVVALFLFVLIFSHFGLYVGLATSHHPTFHDQFIVGPIVNHPHFCNHLVVGLIAILFFMIILLLLMLLIPSPSFLLAS